MVADGFGPAQYTLARLAASGQKLALDGLLVGAISTSSSDSIVTDSAAGATAYSCGMKTFNKGVAVQPNGKACATLLEAAKHAKMRTGLVVTSEVTHATPAAFATHVMDRDNYGFIAQQLLDQRVDVTFGGGAQIFEHFDLYGVAEAHYKLITTEEELETETLTLPVMGLFAPSHLDYSIDNNTAQPTLSQMVEKALPLLSKDNSKGFFLMVEGSRIDHACHANDVAAAVQEILAFDKAVQVVTEFAESNENTLVVIVADHETGGLSIGKNGQYAFNLTALQQIHHSIAYINSHIPQPVNTANLIAAVQMYLPGLWASGDDATYFSGVYTSANSSAAINNYINAKTLTGWTTNAHTGVDIHLFVFGRASSNFVGGGVFANNVIGQMMASIMKFDLASLTAGLANVDTSGGMGPLPPSFGRTADRNVAATRDPYHNF